jgi:hypothetical protein
MWSSGARRERRIEKSWAMITAVTKSESAMMSSPTSRDWAM